MLQNKAKQKYLKKKLIKWQKHILQLLQCKQKISTENK